MNQIFESIDFVQNPLYEQIISDIGTKQYSIIENFFSEEDVLILRQLLLKKHEEDAFKKSSYREQV